jgi:hypothetical protein
MDGRILRSVAWVCLCAGAFNATSIQAALYVDAGATGTGDGSSWRNAFPHLQDALVAAARISKPVEIRVAQGVYRPDQGAGITSGDQAAAFQLLNGVCLQGGYVGWAGADPNTRDVQFYETILSGDLKGNDNEGALTDKDNSCCVVVARLVDESAVMDGFTIRGSGRWGGCDEEHGKAAEMVIDAARPLLQHCRFPANRVHGLLNRNGSAPTFVACRFDETEIVSTESGLVVVGCLFQEAGMSTKDYSRVSVTDCMFEPGGMNVRQASTATVTRCIFQGGSGVAVDDSNAVLTNCTFRGNKEDFALEGIITSNESHLTFVDCHFIQNRGHVISGRGLTVNLSRCSFVGNSGWASTPVSLLGGSLVLQDCEFIGNSVQYGAGAVDVMGEQLRATGCVFAGNSAGDVYGPGAILGGTTLLLLTNCTFVGNRGLPNTIEYLGNGLTSPAELTNSIVWDGPSPFTRYPEVPPRIRATYSDIQGGYAGEGNIEGDPCFVDPGHWADPNDPNIVLGPEHANAVWAGGDYHLKSQAGRWDRGTQTWVRDETTSACIDAGDPNTPAGLEPFPNGGVVNLGAYGGTGEASKSYCGEAIPVTPSGRASR